MKESYQIFGLSLRIEEEGEPGEERVKKKHYNLQKNLSIKLHKVVHFFRNGFLVCKGIIFSPTFCCQEADEPPARSWAQE